MNNQNNGNSTGNKYNYLTLKISLLSEFDNRYQESITSLFGEYLKVMHNISAETLHLTGVAIGGGLFLIVVFIGVIFWISREREEDQEIREEAEKMQGGRRRVNLVQKECFHDDNEDMIEFH